ncbi:MAG: alkaline phosphatase family protein [Candidatus Omnitrophica bacterium]|nr:alkaline phosphatase family protein [Candidatus Omnitrophota bacterium]MBU4303734.1 alkaline phosphatase family protein [Candidatus Omnitrophota bacterium]
MMHKPENINKVIVLGIDAMDPNITEQLIQKGRLPNLSYLKTQGSFSRLITTIPAESVVAWTSFSTGVKPGNHGIFDFVMRDPTNYFLYLSLNEISATPKGPVIRIRRKARTFWDILSKMNIPCSIYFCPNTFPPDKISGKMLSGMGVPDISGTMGKFAFYTTKTLSGEDADSRGRIIQVKFKDSLAETKIYGPRVSSGNAVTESTIPFKAVLTQDKSGVFLEFQGNRFLLRPQEWSDWKRIYFKISPFRKTYGILKFYLKSIEPDFELYLSPINFDPQRSVFPISYPKDYSSKLARTAGLYYTQGMPHDTWALTEGRIDEKAFLEHVDENLREKEKILKTEMREYRNGLFFFYLDTLDAVQHMFWRYIDPRHPLYENNPSYKDTIYKYYERIDRIIGEVLRNLDKDTTLIILSDHGFNSFRKSVHLNRWLLENGFLFLTEGKNEGKEFFDDIDWFRTKAYALGFGGIYLNRVGREGHGIVNSPEVAQIKDAISKKLKAWRDVQTQEEVVKNVYTKEEVFDGSCIDDAPDLFVGFNAGYRASWQTALGGVPNLLIEDNKRKWSGDHLIDPELVPGVIFINKKVELKQPSIIDIVPTILNLFNIPKPKEMQGKILFKDYDK